MSDASPDLDSDLDLVVARTGHERFRDLARTRPGYAEMVRRMAAEFRGEQAVALESPLPGRAAMAGNLASSALAHATDGFRRASEDVIAARLATCEACPHWRASDRRCSLCGCRTRAKAEWRSSACPDRRWPE